MAIDAAHVLIIGATGSGKTFYAKNLFNTSLRRRAVYDPMREFKDIATGENDSRFESQGEFVDFIYTDAAHNCDIFIDEADEILPNKTPHRWLLQRGRHHGIRVVLISQRGALVDLTCRNQCRHVIIFNCAATDYRESLLNFGLESNLRLHIPRFHYIRLTPDDTTLALRTLNQ